MISKIEKCPLRGIEVSRALAILYRPLSLGELLAKRGGRLSACHTSFHYSPRARVIGSESGHSREAQSSVRSCQLERQ